MKCAFAMYAVVADGRVTDAPNRAPLSIMWGPSWVGTWGYNGGGESPWMGRQWEDAVTSKVIGTLETPPALRGGRAQDTIMQNKFSSSRVTLGHSEIHNKCIKRHIEHCKSSTSDLIDLLAITIM